MTFYQELQLGQAGSKNLIRACETPRDRLLSLPESHPGSAEHVSSHLLYR